MSPPNDIVWDCMTWMCTYSRGTFANVDNTSVILPMSSESTDLSSTTTLVATETVGMVYNIPKLVRGARVAKPETANATCLYS